MEYGWNTDWNTDVFFHPIFGENGAPRIQVEYRQKKVEYSNFWNTGGIRGGIQVEYGEIRFG